ARGGGGRSLRPQRLQPHELLVIARIDALYLFFLIRDEARLRGQRLIVLVELALELCRRLGRILGVELLLGIELLALLMQLLDALLRGADHIVHSGQRLVALLVVRRLVRVAGEQRAVAPFFFGEAVAFFEGSPCLFFFGGAFIRRE